MNPEILQATNRVLEALEERYEKLELEAINLRGEVARLKAEKRELYEQACAILANRLIDYETAAWLFRLIAESVEECS